jgi:5-methylcytosine-specific restriction endonuclease McrA
MAIANGGYCCAQCGRRHTRLFVDHVTEIKDGGAPLDQANLRPLCGSCHSRKTAAERVQRVLT